MHHDCSQGISILPVCCEQEATLHEELANCIHAPEALHENLLCKCIKMCGAFQLSLRAMTAL